MKSKRYFNQLNGLRIVATVIAVAANKARHKNWPAIRSANCCSRRLSETVVQL